MTEKCVFCQIIAGTAPSEIVFQDEQVTAFKDQHPAAPVHLLIAPNRHIASLNQAGPEDTELLGHMVITARQLAGQNNLSGAGYRLVINTGKVANQTVFHLHLHLLGGQDLPGLTQ